MVGGVYRNNKSGQRVWYNISRRASHLSVDNIDNIVVVVDGHILYDDKVFVINKLEMFSLLSADCLLDP